MDYSSTIKDADILILAVFLMYLKGVEPLRGKNPSQKVILYIYVTVSKRSVVKRMNSRLKYDCIQSSFGTSLDPDSAGLFMNLCMI